MNIDNTILKEELIPSLKETCDKFEINTVLRVAHFVAQTSHESGDYTVRTENLKYSAPGLAKTWSKRFANEDKTPNDLALSVAYQSEKIANIVYANRLGNGDENSGEGFKFRGRGFIQLTGKSNYVAISKDLGIDFITNPDLLLQDEYSFLSAGWFWNRNKLNSIADLGIDNATISMITRKINGGLIGIEDRVIRLNKYYNKLILINEGQV